MVLFLASSLGNCNRQYQTQILTACTKEQAVTVANHSMKKAHKNLGDLTTTVAEDSSYIYIIYRLKTRMIGGGGEIKVSKTDCQIVDRKYYQ